MATYTRRLAHLLVFELHTRAWRIHAIHQNSTAFRLDMKDCYFLVVTSPRLSSLGFGGEGEKEGKRGKRFFGGERKGEEGGGKSGSKLGG